MINEVLMGVTKTFIHQLEPQFICQHNTNNFYCLPQVHSLLPCPLLSLILFHFIEWQLVEFGNTREESINWVFFLVFWNPF